MARTDVHAPGSVDFDPEAYTLIDCFDLTPPTDTFGFSGQNLGAEITRLEKLGYTYGNKSAGACAHCGTTALRYVALLVREDVKEWIFVGETCLSHRFLGQTKASFTALRKAAQLDREAQKRLAEFHRLCELNGELAFVTYLDNIFAASNEIERDAIAWGTNVGTDIARKVRRYGNPSLAQLNLLKRIVAEQEERIAKAYEKAAEKALREAEAATLPELVEGRRELTGTIKSTRWQESDYGSTLKCLVELEDGNRVWGSVPGSIPDCDELVGAKFTFTAAVTRSDDDEHFGFYKRPTKATVTFAE